MTARDSERGVLVAVNHFAEREIVVSGDDGASEETTTEGGDGGADDSESSDGGGQPGFGVTAALAALLSVVFGVRFRR